MTKERKQYTLTPEDRDKLLEAGSPMSLVAVNCVPLRSPQQSINNAWARLGDRMGFVGSTAAPVGVNLFKFTAVPK